MYTMQCKYVYLRDMCNVNWHFEVSVTMYIHACTCTHTCSYNRRIAVDIALRLAVKGARVQYQQPVSVTGTIEFIV